MRKTFIAGNWKMNLTVESGRELALQLKERIGGVEAVDVAVCPPFPLLLPVSEALKGTNIKVGAQNMYFEPKGAFTGEVSGEMLKSAGCTYVIIGHSERRHIFGEDNELINRKVHAALQIGLKPILCVGEQLSEREEGKTEQVVREQVLRGVDGLSAEQFADLTIAYEPVWAIGTGKTATPQQAQEVHQFIRELISREIGSAVADALRIQYGGSVKPENAAGLLEQPDIDGALVGGASLDADSFTKIVQAAPDKGE